MKNEFNDNDYEICFNALVPYIGEHKKCPYFFKLINFFMKKIEKKDDLSNIYRHIFLCFFGPRERNDNKGRDFIYERVNEKVKECLKMLLNILLFMIK